jgi:hypothetical protein
MSVVWVQHHLQQEEMAVPPGVVDLGCETTTLSHRAMQ